MRELYRQAGLPEPQTVHWYGSPAEMLAELTCPAFASQLGANVWHSLGGALGDRTWRTFWEHVGIAIGSTVWKQTRGHLWQSVGRSNNNDRVSAEAPYDKLLTHGRADTGVSGFVERNHAVEQLRFLDGETSGGRTGEYYYDETWISEMLPTYAFFHEIVGVSELAEVGPLIRLVESAGPWIAFERAALITERPTAFATDERGNLHCEDGPALAYRTSTPLYAWHGVQVPDDIILRPETITPKRIRKEPNVEVRRVMAERFGVERYLRSGKAVLRNQSEHGRLWTATPGSFNETTVWLEVQNSTPEPDGSHKTYILAVPPHCETAHEAVAWTFGMRPEEYNVTAES